MTTTATVERAEDRKTVIVIGGLSDAEVSRVRDAVKERCEVEGCDRPQTSRGLCTMHYARAKKLQALSSKEAKGVEAAPEVRKAAQAMRA